MWEGKLFWVSLFLSLSLSLCLFPHIVSYPKFQVTTHCWYYIIIHNFLYFSPIIYIIYGFHVLTLFQFLLFIPCKYMKPWNGYTFSWWDHDIGILYRRDIFHTTSWYKESSYYQFIFLGSNPYLMSQSEVRGRWVTVWEFIRLTNAPSNPSDLIYLRNTSPCG